MKVKFWMFFIVFIFMLIILTNNTYASTKLNCIENFPESYKPYLYELKKKYPNWQFTALYTNLDWNNVIRQEYANSKNLVPINYSDNWKCKENGLYNVEIDSGWVNASRNAIEYTMDPRSFLNEVRIFQFEKLSYDTRINTKEGIERILYGTEFYKRQVTYKDSNGNNIIMNQVYSDLIMDAAVYSGVNPYHLAARIKQEVGPFVTHSSISGSVAGYEGLYNFFNIGATSSTEYLGAIKNGLTFARDGKGASEETKANLLLPWNTPEKAIKGGAIFIGSSYISVGQNTLYLQKFDVNDDRGSDLFWHQYMTNCLAPYTESYNIHRAYSSNGMLNSSIGFVIPIYNNMPEIPTSTPNILSSDYEEDNTKVYADVTTTLNVRSGPSTSYEIITSITRDEDLTRIAKGIQSGERWDKVILENGIIGYVFQSYIKEKEEIQIPEEPELPIEPEVPEEPEEPEIPEVEEPPLEEKPAEIPEEIIFNESLNVIDGNFISGLKDTKVSEVKKLITTELEMKFLNKNEEVLTDEENIGTASKVIFTKPDNTTYEYTFILYGDVNGDSSINSLDVLVIQKHILETKLLTGVFLKAGNISRNGANPSSLDVLKIQKHILEIKFIEQ